MVCTAVCLRLLCLPFSSTSRMNGRKRSRPSGILPSGRSRHSCDRTSAVSRNSLRSAGTAGLPMSTTFRTISERFSSSGRAFGVRNGLMYISSSSGSVADVLGMCLVRSYSYILRRRAGDRARANASSSKAASARTVSRASAASVFRRSVYEGGGGEGSALLTPGCGFFSSRLPHPGSRRDSAAATIRQRQVMFR